MNSAPDLATYFDLHDQIGAGGFGRVYRATFRTTGEVAAVKVGHRMLAEAERARVFREATLLRGLHHPHLTRFFGAFDAGAHGVALAYELVPGAPLDQVAGEARPESRRVLRWVSEVGAALDRLHSVGLVHRDVKPENIMIRPDDTACLLDFGLLRPREAGATVTAEGLILGTPQFMAPECFRGERAEPAWDRFALAATAFWILAGHPPSESVEVEEILRGLAMAPPALPCLPGISDTVRARLDDVFARGLARDPADRPASGGLLALRLREAWEGGGSQESVLAVPPQGTGATVVTGTRDGTLVVSPSQEMVAGRGHRRTATQRPLAPTPIARRVMTTRRWRRQVMRPVLALLGAGLLTAAVAMALRSGGGLLPQVPSDPAAHGEEPPEVPAGEAARLEELADGIGDRLSDLETVHVGLDGGSVGAGTPGARRLLDGEPVLWPVLLREIPQLVELRGDLLRKLGRTRPPAELRQLGRVDRLLEPTGFPPFVAPYLKRSTSTAPGPLGPDLVRLLDLPGCAGPRRLEGLAGAAVRELEDAIAAFGDLMLELEASETLEEMIQVVGPRGGAVRDLLLYMRSVRGADVDTGREFHYYLDSAFRLGRYRARVSRFMEPLAERVHRGLLLVGRSLREEPENRSKLALVLEGVLLQRVEVLFLSHLVTRSSEALLGNLPEGDPLSATVLVYLDEAREEKLRITGESVPGVLLPLPLRLSLARTAVENLSREDPCSRRLLRRNTATLLRLLAEAGRLGELAPVFEAQVRGQPDNPELLQLEYVMGAILDHQAAPLGLSVASLRRIKRRILAASWLGRKFGATRTKTSTSRTYRRLLSLRSANAEELARRFDGLIATAKAAAPPPASGGE